MMPSAALRMASKCRRAPARSIFAMMNGDFPRACAATRTAWMSAAVSTNDWPIASTRAQCKLEADPVVVRKSADAQLNAGRFRPLRDRSSPPTRTKQLTSLPVTRSTFNCTSPSFTNSRSPGFTTWGRRAKLTEIRCGPPGISSVVSVKPSPGAVLSDRD